MTELHPPHYRKDRLLIGCAETVDLPEWGIAGLRAKIDTGAHTSALHVDRIEMLPHGRVRFDVILNRKSGRRVTVETRVLRTAKVRSTSGHIEDRYCVSTVLKLGSVEKEIEVTLASRDPMRFRMLLGRMALAGDFLIDASRRYAATPHPSEMRATQPKKRKRHDTRGTRHSERP